MGLTVHVQDWPTISRTTTRVAVGSMNDRGKSKCDIVTANNIFLLSFVVASEVRAVTSVRAYMLSIFLFPLLTRTSFRGFFSCFGLPPLII